MMIYEAEFPAINICHGVTYMTLYCANWKRFDDKDLRSAQFVGSETMMHDCMIYDLSPHLFLSLSHHRLLSALHFHTGL